MKDKNKRVFSKTWSTDLSLAPCSPAMLLFLPAISCRSRTICSFSCSVSPSLLTILTSRLGSGIGEEGSVTGRCRFMDMFGVSLFLAELTEPIEERADDDDDDDNDDDDDDEKEEEADENAAEASICCILAKKIRCFDFLNSANSLITSCSETSESSGC